MECYNPAVTGIYSPTKFYIETLGCQANEADSVRMTHLLESLGLEPTKDFTKADMFIVNSCSVRQKSEDKVYGWARKINQLSKKPFVVLAGCMVGSVKGDRTRYSFKELEDRTLWVDLYLSPEELFKLPRYLQEAGILPDPPGKAPSQESSPDASASKTSSLKDSPIFVDDKTGYVNISYGCDNFCTYCVVPYARGEEVSRSKDEILQEVKILLDKGITHITLCGQNVNSWGLSSEKKRQIRIGDDNKLPFAQLLREVHDLAGIEKLTFLSSNPFDFTKDLIEAIKLPKIDDYLHIAVQSGNNDVLARMNRRHTIEEFLDLVTQIKKARPSVELGTDVIVGFPQETREQFMDTVNLFKQVKFNVAFIAMYSPRKGTAAEKMFEDDVPLKEKKWRHAYLTKVWRENKPSR
ncbi:MiaB/RimO family radical SAM methylthiotransferase [candidate division WWE3 bacterium]|nr:MiaB/RimO family radical SAM methylthiotransferase [candidate division WWE3 bacterium]